MKATPLSAPAQVMLRTGSLLLGHLVHRFKKGSSEVDGRFFLADLQLTFFDVLSGSFSMFWFPGCH